MKTMTDISGIVAGMLKGLALSFEYFYIWLPLVLGIIAYQAWAGYQREKYLAGLKWTVLEVIPPPDVPFSTAKAAENIFSGLHATYTGGLNWKTQFFQGKVPPWFSFEIVSDGGTTHFIIRCTEDQRNNLEVLIFSQYPDAEIRVVPDYIDVLPEKIDLAQYDISGTEYEFTKEPVYPIKTYAEFEEAGGKDQYARLDPLAPLMEIMSALRPGEHLWVQYLFRATGGDWAKENQKVVDKLMGKAEKPPEDPLVTKIILFPFTLINAFLVFLGAVAPEEKKEEKKDDFNLQKLTAAQRKVLEQVEFKMAKLAFKTGIRVLYTASKEVFNGSRTASVSGMYKQLFYTNLNAFKPGNGTRDKGMFPWVFPNDKGFFADERTAQKKHMMYGMYRSRAFPFKLMILNTEELATLWHLPGLNVRAPLMPRVQAKQGQPPAILPTR